MNKKLIEYMFFLVNCRIWYCEGNIKTEKEKEYWKNELNNAQLFKNKILRGEFDHIPEENLLNTFEL